MGFLKDAYDVLSRLAASNPQLKAAGNSFLSGLLKHKGAQTLGERKTALKNVVAHLTKRDLADNYPSSAEFFHMVVGFLAETASVCGEGCIVDNLDAERNYFYYFPPISDAYPIGLGARPGADVQFFSVQYREPGDAKDKPYRFYAFRPGEKSAAAWFDSMMKVSPAKFLAQIEKLEGTRSFIYIVAKGGHEYLHDNLMVADLSDLVQLGNPRSASVLKSIADGMQRTLDYVPP